MTDRELLELAAKAAGIGAGWLCLEDADFDMGHEGMWPRGARSPDNSKFWNPLTDDGDAFRLMVDLRLELYFGEHGVEVRGTPTPGVVYGKDMPTSARQAIALAAAEVGRAMP